VCVCVCKISIIKRFDDDDKSKKKNFSSYSVTLLHEHDRLYILSHVLIGKKKSIDWNYYINKQQNFLHINIYIYIYQYIL